MLTADNDRQTERSIKPGFYSANLYLQMSAWCADKGFEGAAAVYA